jgi:TIR domain-containing protein
MADVFLSYAREDRDTALRLAQALEARGWSVWWDREIIAGEAFDQAIERELAGARAVIVLWSKRSIASEWVKNEAADAADRGLLVPALLDDARLPLEFRRRQAADLAGWSGDVEHQGFRALCDGVVAKVTKPAAKRSEADAPIAVVAAVPLASHTKATLPARYIVATALVLLALGAGLYAWRGRGAAPSASATPASTPPASGGSSALADLVTGIYSGDVVSDARGHSQSDVTVTITKLGTRRVRISADYERLRAVEVDLTQIGGKVMSAAGPSTLMLENGRLEYSPDGEVSYVGRRRP